MWKSALGLETRLVAEEFRSLIAHIESSEAVLFRSSWIADYNDPWTFAAVMAKDSGNNLTHYASASYDARLDKAAAVMSAAARASELEAAERQLLEDVPVIPLYHYLNKHLVSTHITGWYDNVLNVTYTKDLEWRRD
jgi:oligopeptide transport system substrate-binding protein